MARYIDPNAPRYRLSTTGAALTHGILRIGTGLLFIEHGVQKLFGWLGGVPGSPSGTVELFSIFGLAGVLELVGGFLIVVGFLTRPVAGILLVEMLIAYGYAHLPKGGLPLQNGGELALLYALVWAFLAANGPGPMSLDGRMRRRREIAGGVRR